MAKIISQSYPIARFNGIPVNTSILSFSANYTKCSSRNVLYIVLHYTGNTKDMAVNNAKYFNGGNRGASAHYILDETSCYQSVALKDKAFAVGGTKIYKHPTCRNSNSISIEMCCSGNYKVSKKTITNAAYLTAELCRLIGISAEQVDTYVLRHYDVWAKSCPAQWATPNNAEWIAFKNTVKSLLRGNNVSAHWGEEYLNKMTAKGFISDTAFWRSYDSPVPKAQGLVLLDKITGGTWKSNESNPSIWYQPHVISLCGKRIIEDKNVWLRNPDASLSKALVLALIDKATNGTLAKYNNASVDHWGRRHLNSLCDKGIITTPSSWTNFEGCVTRAQYIALLCKAFSI